MRPAQIAGLAAGVAITVLGGVLLAQQEGALGLDGGWLGAVVTALSGVALVASGLSARER